MRRFLPLRALAERPSLHGLAFQEPSLFGRVARSDMALGKFMTEDVAGGGRRAFHWAGFILGISLGGFFDGILLHQVLQWHHLLSLMEGRSGDLPFQIAADGYFHVLMYAIAVVGLVLLWRSHRRVEDRGRLLLSNILIGVGVWNIVDIAGFHWLIGIHRIRVDVPNPMFWDLLWLGLFGVVPLILAYLVRRGGSPDMRAAVAPTIATLVVVGAAAWAARPPADDRFTTVLFAPGVTKAEAILAVASIGGRPAWIDASGRVIVFENGETEHAIALYRRGAMLVGNTVLPAGCLDWSRASAA